MHSFIIIFLQFSEARYLLHLLISYFCNSDMELISNTIFIYIFFCIFVTSPLIFLLADKTSTVILLLVTMKILNHDIDFYCS